MQYDQDIKTRYRDVKRLWSIRKEKTCTYGKHIGHYKSVMKHDWLSWLFFQKGDIPAISGYAPKRHRKCVDLMIMKKENNYKYSAQRKLGILDTEFNNNNKLVAKVTRDNGLQLGAIADEQFSRKGRSAIEDTLSKRLFIDHQQSYRVCCALTSSDLGGCYDRIIHTAAALALLSIGVPKSRIHAMFSVIQNMIHRIRTAFGDSELTYGGETLINWENQPQDILQGNTAGPDIWSALSPVVFKILHKRGFGCKIITSISKQLFTLVGFAYVDDCDLMQTGCDPIEVLTSMQKLINSWGSLMEVTGGVLRTDKSWYYLIDYIWKQGKWVATDPDIGIDLMADDISGKRLTLFRLRCDEAAEMLGVWMAPDGSRSKVASELKASAVEWVVK